MPTTLLSLPVEIRFKIYNYVLSSCNIHSVRPQRKIGWNRPHADLSNPTALFESESHPVLRLLFHSKITKLDHSLILAVLLQHIKVLIVDHADFAALQKLASTSTQAGPGLTTQARSNAMIVRDNLRTIDFSDKLDEIVCQPSDLTKLLNGLQGLRAVHLASKHIQRYSGTIDDHVEFARDRAAGAEGEKQSQSQSSVIAPAIEQTVDEFRRMNLRSPMTDGSRMMISPALFSSRSSSCRWVVVDLSMIVWQHFLYTGAPYKDHWRCVKMQTLLATAEKKGMHVVMNFRNVEFDPPSRIVSSGSTRSNRFLLSSMAFRGEMSTADWTLRLRHRVTGVEYAVRQRRQYDVPGRKSV
ncbi:hypothetical protein H2198_002809 [Neophaeococcomyces mojaviensis]|uniref:Uncharacterized protein n=1 Tax=Neophaeococcomyces mojaviensis TaxID=3383035 RepID=A0ACC3ADA1_9EURO|nr:hypothetical protein H2198_002809 [Knufia sp. JES_112]